MKTKAIASHGVNVALALGLGLITIMAVATIARVDITSSRSRRNSTEGDAASPAAADFICHAPAGNWCDLRDWSGMDHQRKPAQPPASN